ncbi:MAG TPA: ROK family protein [Candidatus Acidoferrales bacterium]|nr:ROK family protein [Candidatus Acidoferrales bacterium]
MRPKSQQKLFIGVDIGGTKVAAGAVNATGEIVVEARGKMVARGTAEDGLRSVTDVLDSLLRTPRARSASAIGISVPGWIDSARGTLIGAANIPCWKDFPLARQIAKRYRLRARIGNDANVAALAEAAWGAGVGYRNVFYVTLGTGIGTGIVQSGRIYEGRTGCAGEGGHTTIDFHGPLCNCGKRGCIEAFASGTAIGKNARQRLLEGGVATSEAASKMLTLTGGKIEAVTSEIVAKAASRGDKLADEVLRETAERLAIWLGNIIELFEPDAIVIGGGAGRLMMSRMKQIRDALETWSINPRWREIPIVAAKYGAESAVAGAAALWLPSAAFKRRQTAG